MRTGVLEYIIMQCFVACSSLLDAGTKGVHAEGLESSSHQGCKMHTVFLIPLNEHFFWIVIVRAWAGGGAGIITRSG